MTIAISCADYKQQVELEKWCYQVGADRLLAGNWQAGASNFLLQHCASDHLNAVFQWVGQARVRPTSLGHVIDMLGDDDETIAKVALEALSFVLDVNDSLKKTTLSAAIGRRSEFVLYLCHPIWGSELHLKGLHLVCGRSLGMDVMRRRLTVDGFRKAEAYKSFTRTERMARAISCWRAAHPTCAEKLLRIKLALVPLMPSQETICWMDVERLC